jgi:hypothetical protein
MRFREALIVVAIAAWVASCGPEVDEDMPPGDLVYSDAFNEIYRLDRRVEVVAVDSMFGQDGCGYLTDRADDDLETTIEALDPSKDYVADPEVCQALEKVYIEGFEHSPFACYWMCCHHDLMPIANVYLAVFSNLSGQAPIIDGEPYVALEPDQPCP